MGVISDTDPQPIILNSHLGKFAIVEMTVTSDDPAVIARIKGLGFFGLMASQDHHREHHMMMARGEDAHRH